MAKDSDLKEEQQVAKWHDRISVSKRWRDQVAQENNWDRYIDEFKGKYDVVLGNQQVPPIGEVFAYKDAVIANLYSRDPFIAVNPRKEASIAGAYLLEAGVNHLWRELKIKEDVELEMTDTILVGHAWHKTGNVISTSGSGDALKLEEDSIYSNRVSWRDMFMNVGCKRPTKDNLWIAQRIYLPTDDVKKKYGKAAKNINGSSYPSIDQKFLKTLLYKEDFNFSAIFEIWDAKERKIYTLSDETTNTFLEDPRDWPDSEEEFPFDFMSFHEIPDEPYPQSDVAAWEPQVLEKIKVFTMMLNHVKRWNRQLLMRKGAMLPSEVDKFEKGIDGSILYASTTGDIQAAFKMLDFGSLPPDIYIILDRLDAVIRKVNGMPEFAYGGTPKTTTRTSGELELIKGGADARTERKQDRIERHCANIARHLIVQLKNNFSVPYIAKVTGKEPPEIIKAFEASGIYDPTSQTIRFKSDDIKGEYDVTVKTGSTLPLDKGTRDQILDKVMEQGVQLAAVPSIPPFLQAVMTERLKDYEMPQLEAAFKQQQEDAKAQQEQQSEQANIESNKTVAETSKRSAQAQQIQLDTLIKGVHAAGKATGQLAPEESLLK